jgi:hypothetical protein
MPKNLISNGTSVEANAVLNVASFNFLDILPSLPRTGAEGGDSLTAYNVLYGEYFSLH